MAPQPPIKPDRIEPVVPPERPTTQPDPAPERLPEIDPPAQDKGTPTCRRKKFRLRSESFALKANTVGPRQL